MFKRSFLGYSRKSMEQAKLLIDRQAGEQKEQIEKSLNSAREEQAGLANELVQLTGKLEQTRLSTVLADKFQENISTVISEVRASIEKINAQRMEKTRVYIRETDEQISLLDQQIDLIKGRIHDMVQGLAGVCRAANYSETEGELCKSKLRDMSNDFKTRARESEESGIPSEFIKLKGLNGGDLFLEEEENRQDLYEERNDTISEQEETVPPEAGFMENKPDEDQSKKFFDQMRQSLENSASLYIKLKEETTIAEDEEYILRTQKFLESMRHYWQSSVESPPAAEEAVPGQDDRYAIRAEQFLDNMRQYWRNSVSTPTMVAEPATGGDDSYELRAEKFLDNMRNYWKTEVLSSAPHQEIASTMEDESYRLRAQRFLDNMRLYWRS